MIPSMIEDMTIIQCNNTKGRAMSPSGAKSLFELIKILPTNETIRNIIHNAK